MFFCPCDVRTLSEFFKVERFVRAHSRMFTRKKNFEKDFFRRAYLDSNRFRINRFKKIDKIEWLESIDAWWLNVRIWRFESMTRRTYVRDRRIRFFSLKISRKMSFSQNVLLGKVSREKSLAKIPPRVKSFYVVRSGQLRRDRSCSPTRYVTRATLRVYCDMGLLGFWEEYYIF